MGAKSKLAKLGGLGASTGVLFALRDHIGDSVDKYLSEFMKCVADKTVSNVSKSQMFNYYMEKMSPINYKLGTDIATYLFFGVGVPIIIGIGGYLLARYLDY